MVRIPASRLKTLDCAATGSPDGIAYVAAAVRIVNMLSQEMLLAPSESSVIPLPHQIRALFRAISRDRVRYLLADEVGLGKTVEAGLILRELKLRGLVKRTLGIAPKGLVNQWVSEMRFHFGETFQLVPPDDIKSLKRIVPGADHKRTDAAFPPAGSRECTGCRDSADPRRLRFTASRWTKGAWRL